MHVSVIARSKWEARQRRDEYRGKKIGGGEVNVKGNAINGFVRSSQLKDGWPWINEQINERRRESVREGCPFLNCLFRD